MVLFKHKSSVHMSHVFTFFAVQPGTGTCGSDSQLGCSFQDGFKVLGRTTGNNLSTVKFVTHKQQFLLYDRVDQKLLGATEKKELPYLVVLIDSVGH